MNQASMLDGFLSDLGATIGLELVLDQNGSCALQFGSGLRCSIELPKNSAIVYFRAPMLSLPDVPENKQEQLYKKLLKLNFFCLETRGATFALDESHQQIILCFAQPVAALKSSTGFENIFAHFIETSLSWYQELNRFLVDQETENTTQLQEQSDSLPSDPRFWV